MISKTIIFCAIFVVISGQTTPISKIYQKPQPPPDAQACIAELKTAGINDQCHNYAMKIWDPLKRGEEMGSLRETCCETYGEIDCFMNATKNSGHCKTTQQGMMNHQRSLIGWLQRTMCGSYKYHSGNCDPDQYNQFPPPQPQAVVNCNLKISQKVNHCEFKAKKDWKVKSTDGPNSQSVCCSKFQTNDCYISAAKTLCNQTEFTQFHKYYHDMSINITKINCTDNAYQSFKCFNPTSDFPPPAPPAAMNCTGKIFERLGVCSDHAHLQWNDSLAVLTGRNACCANWDVYDCMLPAAQDKCTLLELSEFEQYYNYLTQVISKTNCSSFGYHSTVCKSVIRHPISEVTNCLKKFNAPSCVTNSMNAKYNIKGINATNRQTLTACCQQLSINKCQETKAMSYCSSNEVGLLQNYLLDKTNIKCGQNQLSLTQCHGTSSSTALHSNLTFAGLMCIMVFLLKFFK